MGLRSTNPKIYEGTPRCKMATNTIESKSGNTKGHSKSSMRNGKTEPRIRYNIHFFLRHFNNTLPPLRMTGKHSFHNTILKTKSAKSTNQNGRTKNLTPRHGATPVASFHFAKTMPVSDLCTMSFSPNVSGDRRSAPIPFTSSSLGRWCGYP